MNLFPKITQLFKTKLAHLSQFSTMHEITLHYPGFSAFLERKYSLKLQPEDQSLTLEKYCERNALPPAQILFMEVQLQSRIEKINQVTAYEAKQLTEKKKDLEILDVREDWEIKMGTIPNSQVLTPQLLSVILSEWPKDQLILFYCHFGIRSMDAASYLADRGFTRVSVIKGGIDAWSLNIDPKIKRYTGNYC